MVVLVVMMVTTFGRDSDSVSVCLLVVSNEALADRLSVDVIVELTIWRLTWRGK
jgi:hypothetical protein